MIGRDKLDKAVFQIASQAPRLWWLNQNICPKNYEFYTFGISKADLSTSHSATWEKNGIQETYTHTYVNDKISISRYNMLH